MANRPEQNDFAAALGDAIIATARASEKAANSEVGARAEQFANTALAQAAQATGTKPYEAPPREMPRMS